MADKRFVFLISKTGDEVLDGSAVEIRAETSVEAIGRTESWRIVQEGATFTLIGERVGFRSTARFIPYVPLEELPGHIVQNEKVAA